MVSIAQWKGLVENKLKTMGSSPIGTVEDFVFILIFIIQLQKKKKRDSIVGFLFKKFERINILGYRAHEKKTTKS